MLKRIDSEERDLLRRKSKDFSKSKLSRKLRNSPRLSTIFSTLKERKHWLKLMRKSFKLKLSLRDSKRRPLMLNWPDKRLLLIESNSKRRLRTRK